MDWDRLAGTPAVRSWNHTKLMMSHCAGVTVTAVLFTGGVTCRTTVAILSVACFGAAFAFAAEQVLTPLTLFRPALLPA
jgi:hypothetical protein